MLLTAELEIQVLERLSRGNVDEDKLTVSILVL